MPVKIYTAKDGNIKPLKGKTLAVIGYGAQGRAHALNLKDSGLNVIIGLYPKSKSIAAARKHGFEVYTTANAVKKADVILMAAPDMKHAEIYEKDIKPNISEGKTLVFIHGMSIHAGFVKPQAGINVIMVAPKGLGREVRAQFVDGGGIPALIATAQGNRAECKKLALAWASGIGSLRAGVMETTFKEETEADLFGEQCVLCGGLSALALAGFETLVEAGYKPEMAYFECIHELKLIVNLIAESGFSGMRKAISETAKYGDITRGQRVIGKDVKRNMKKILKEIQSGEFTNEWKKEYAGGLVKYNKLLAAGEKHLAEKTGMRMRALMPCIARENIKGAKAAFADGYAK